MPITFPLITTIAMGFSLALIMGFIALKLKLPALVGYLVAGVAIGPFTPGVVADVKVAKELAELGIMLLMFGVGLHFSLADLMRVRKIAIPGAIVQMLAATFLGACVGHLWGFSLVSAIIFGLTLSVASTVVLLRTLEERGMLTTMNGHISVGWLLVEDLAMVIILVLLPAFSNAFEGQTQQQSIGLLLVLTFIKVSIFITLMLVIGRRIFPKILAHIARTGSRELFTLCIITAAISVAYVAAKLFDVSVALGAFFAGMTVRESSFSHRAKEESLPFRDAFVVLFFVAVGMLFNPKILIDHPLQVLTVVGIIVVGKSVAACLLVLAFRYPLRSALVVSASLAQIGEFSFILTELGIQYGLFPIEGRSVILAGALISMAINPLLFTLIEPIHAFAKAHCKWSRIFERLDDPLAELPKTTKKEYLSKQVVLLGYGRVGQRIANLLSEQGLPYVIIDESRELVLRLRSKGFSAVYGDAFDPNVLIQSHIAEAGMLIIVISDVIHISYIIKYAKKLNPNIEIVIRAHSEKEARFLQKENRGQVFLAEDALALTIGRYTLNRYGKSLKMNHKEQK
jgi:CPA2 family monovalent cation:H+ antiporter-2